MNIQNIQIAQGLFRTTEERFNSRKENISSHNDASVPQMNVPEAQAVDIPKASIDKDLMTVVYPPFFPIGNTQDIPLIEGVKQLAGEDVKSGPSVSVEGHEAIKQQGNSKAAGPDAGAVKAKAPQVEYQVNPGVVLDFKI